MKYEGKNLPSQLQLDKMQRPLDRHLKSDSGQGRLQFCSSEPSPQSSVPNNNHSFKQLVIHWNF